MIEPRIADRSPWFDAQQTQIQNRRGMDGQIVEYKGVKYPLHRQKVIAPPEPKPDSAVTASYKSFLKLLCDKIRHDICVLNPFSSRFIQTRNGFHEKSISND